MITTAAVVLVYTALSSSIMFLNSHILKTFPFPVAVSLVGQCASLAAARLGAEPSNDESNANMFAVGATTSFTIICGQYPYMHLSTAFIQMLKAFTPIYMIVLLYALRIETPSFAATACVIGMTISGILAAAGEINFHLWGFSLMMASCVGDSVRLVLTQQVLTRRNKSQIDVLYRVNCYALSWSIAALLATERGYASAVTMENAWMLTISALMGVGVNVCSIFVVQRTSSLFFKAVSIARNAGVLVVSTVFFGERTTSLELLGYTCVLGFFLALTWLKTPRSGVKPAILPR